MSPDAAFRGVKLNDGAAQVALFSRSGTAAWLCLFTGEEESARIPLAKEGDVFRAEVKDLKPGQHYGFRVDGPWQPEKGLYCDKQKLLLDPFASRISRPFASNPELGKFGVDTASLVPKCIIEQAAPEIPPRTIGKTDFIYELNIRSFTMLHPAVPEHLRGTALALAEPAVIEHIRALGVDTVEIMPIHAWIDEDHLRDLKLRNAWGYNAIQFFAPDPRLCPGGWADLRKAVEALHAAGLQLIVDVVFNHTGEGEGHGPILSLRGLDNTLYYAQTDGKFHNDSGCGNTLALNTPEMTAIVLQSLRHMVLHCGVDGFRFDLGTVLGRTPTGFTPDAPLLTAMTSDPLLGSRILIAEPWDIGPGGYALGKFPSGWREWSDKYRDDTRKFWRGGAFTANAMATRLSGSSDLFGNRKPSASVNFIAAHDGFTLKDLVTYDKKQNDANGEDNRDGNPNEVTWPGGDVRALLATLFFSRGSLMLTAGDEFGRTQGGNNNGYAQDNAITWLDWAKADQSLITFVQALSKCRMEIAPWMPDEFLPQDQAEWFGPAGKPMDWNDGAARVLGVIVKQDGKRLAMVFNASEQSFAFPVPADTDKNWQRRFSSAEAEGCPAKSVSIFEEVARKSA